MKIRSLFLIFIFYIFYFSAHSVNAQQISAEYISSHQPPKLTTGEQVTDGVQGLYYKNNRLYVIDTWAGLQILDVSDVHHPKELGNYFTEHRPHNVVTDSLYAYLSDEMGGVIVIDISDPANIRKVAQVKTKGDAFWAVAKYPYVYVAEETKGVGIYDIRNLKYPRRIGGFETQGWAWALDIEGNTLYAAEKSGGIYILDVSDPAAPKELGSFSQAQYAKSIQVQDKIAYVADGPRGLLIMDCSNPARPKMLSRFVNDGYVFDAYRTGNTVFLSNEQKQRLDIINISNLKKPVQEGSYQAKSKIYASIKHDIYLYVAADESTIFLRYNRPPQIMAVDDQTIDEMTPLEIDVVASDPDQDALVYSVKNLPDSAILDTLSGKFSWTPTYEQSGVYKNITITVTEKTESRLSASTTFNITVKHINRNPSIADVPDYTVDENVPLTFTVPEGADPDKEDAGKLTYKAENLPPGAQFDGKTRTFSWTPTFEQSGVYPVTFVVMDPAGGSAQDVSAITVNHVDRKPVLMEVGNVEIPEDSLVTIKLQGSDPDKEDQNALSYKAENLPPGAKFDAATATFSWRPTFEQSGDYPKTLFVFTAGKLSDSIYVNFRVDHVNRPPVLDAVADQTVDENKTLKFTVQGSDPDKEDQGRLTYAAENLPQGAVFNADSAIFKWTPTFEQSGVYSNVTFKISDPSGLSDSKSITITVKHVNRPPALAEIPAKTIDENTPLAFDLQGSDPDKEDQGKLVYTAKGLPAGAVLDGAHVSWTPTYEQSGVYTIDFTVSDGQLSDSKQTSITVNHVDRPPVLQPVTVQTVDENKELSFTVKGSDPDKEDAGKYYYMASQLPVGAVFDSTSGKFDWTPTFEQSGDYTIKIKVVDPAGLSDEKEVTVKVNHVNRTPVFPEQPLQSVDENQPLTFKVLPAADPDKEDAGKLVYSAEQLPQGAVFDAATQTLSWTPTYEQSGEYTALLKVTDGQFTVSQPLKILVKHVNRPPVVAQPADQIIDENKPWSLKIDFSDPDKEDAGKLTVKAENLPLGAQFDAASATISWTPTYEQAGKYEGLTITVSDPSGLSDSKQFAVEVKNVNRPPALQAVASVSGSENTPVTFTLSAADPDKEDEGKLTFSCANLPEGATLDAQNGAFRWTPTFLQAGKYELKFKVTDGGQLSAEQTAVIDIQDVNRPPALKDVPAQSGKEGEKLTFTVEGSDPDTDNQLNYSAENLPKGASFDAASHTFSWTPGFTQAGSYTITFKVSDGKEEVQKTATINVENVNRAPVFTALSGREVKEDQTLSFKVGASDPDEGTNLTYSVSGLPDGANFDAASQTFNWKPDFTQAGNYNVTFEASDGDLKATQQVSITVENVNRAPEISGPSSEQTEVGQTLSFDYQGKDPDGDELNFKAGGLPSGASLSSDGHFSWTPQEGQSGSYSITVTVSDGQDEASASTSISVKEKPKPAPADTTGQR